VSDEVLLQFIKDAADYEADVLHKPEDWEKEDFVQPEGYGTHQSLVVLLNS
jgi:hypothetical protein